MTLTVPQQIPPNQFKYPRYFWYQGVLCKTADHFDKPMPLPENNLGPFPKRFRYSTRNRDYNKPGSRKVNDKYPKLFDFNEVAAGFYIYPRVVLNPETGKYYCIKKEYWGAPLNVGDRSGNWPIEYITDIYTVLPWSGQPVHVKLPKRDNIKEWRFYPENQCPTSSIIGAMGSGKSLQMCSLENLCLNEEACIMSIDQFCEARHLAEVGQLVNLEDIELEDNDSDYAMPFPQTKNPVTKVIVMTPIEIYIPYGVTIKYVNEKYIKKPNITFHGFSKAEEIIPKLLKGKVVAIYDEAFTFISHNKFWFEIAYFLNRRENIDDVIDIVHHEASKLLPSHPFKGQFEDVEFFSNEYVAFRKAENRTLFGSQLRGENFWRTQQKNTYTWYKAGSTTDSIPNPIMRNIIAHLAIDETVAEYRGRYAMHVFAKFPEGEGKFRMLKQNDVEYNWEEKKAQEEYEQMVKDAKEEKRQQLRDEAFERRKELQREKLESSDYIMEKEMIFKQQIAMAKLEAEKERQKQKEEQALEVERLKLEAEKLKQEKALEKERLKHKLFLEKERIKQQQKQKVPTQDKISQLEKGLLILQANKEITVRAFGDLVGLSNWNSAKKLYDECSLKLSKLTTTTK